MYVIRRW